MEGGFGVVYAVEHGNVLDLYSSDDVGDEY